jgi:cation transport ATPase
MRPILFLLISVIFTACGHHKLRFSKVEKKQKVVEISEIPTLKKSSESTVTHNSEIQEVRPERSENSASTTIESDELQEPNTNIDQQEASITPITEQDSVKVTKVDAEYMKEEAIRAEKLGTWSLVTGIAVPSLFLLAVISLLFFFSGPYNPIAAIISVVLAISMLVSLILSYSFGIASLRAPYNTPQGRKRAIAGITITSIFIFLYLLTILIGLF